MGFRTWPILAALILSGCTGGTETGNPPISAQLSYAAYSSDESVKIREPAEVASVTAVWLALSDVGFTPGAGCSGDVEPAFRAPGIGVGDHASGEPVVTSFTIEPGSYCAVILPFTLAGELPADAPAALQGASVLVVGTLAEGTPFTIRSRVSSAFSLQAADGAFLIEAEQADTLLGFDVGAWLTGIDWASAERDVDTVVISVDRNPALLARFEANLPSGVVLFRDRDGDGRLDQDAQMLAQP